MAQELELEKTKKQIELERLEKLDEKNKYED